jgi:polyisoprenoid-binding protein YceI
VSGDLTLHGQSHPDVLDVNRVDASHFTGSTMVRQTAFGINPIRIAGAAVTVKDDVKVVFEVFLRGK